jgi:uncharacterized protein YjbI with pentapeptide repeats
MKTPLRNDAPLILWLLVLMAFIAFSGADLTDADLRGCDFSLANAQKVRFWLCQNFFCLWFCQ